MVRGEILVERGKQVVTGLYTKIDVKMERTFTLLVSH